MSLNDSKTEVSNPANNTIAGADGDLGSAGEGGYHGRRGLDISRLRWANFYFVAGEDSKIGLIKESNLSAQSYSWSHLISPLSHPSYSRDENDELFCSQNSKRRAQKGKQNGHKSTNRQRLTINSAINKQDIFAATQAFFNTNNSHWLKVQNHAFLAAFAEKLGCTVCHPDVVLQSTTMQSKMTYWLETFISVIKNTEKRMVQTSTLKTQTQNILQDFHSDTRLAVPDRTLFFDSEENYKHLGAAFI